MRSLVFVVAVGLLTLTAPISRNTVDAQIVCPGLNVQLEPYSTGDESITVSSSAVGFTSSKYKPTTNSNNWAVAAVFTVETASIRYRVTGNNPTASVGHLVTSGLSVAVCGFSSLESFRAIAVSTDAPVYVTYYRRR